MTAVYAVALVAGLALLIGWVAAAAVASSVAGWESVDPDRRYGRRGRFVVAGLTGTGMAGMSATFAGWPAWLALVAALAGAAALMGLSTVAGGEG